MSVEKYGKGWRYRFDLGPDPLTGRRRQATRGGFATKREATTAMNEAMQASRNGRFVRRSARTVRDFLTEWLSARQLSLKPSTWQSYQDYAKSYVEPILGDTKLSELTAQRLNLLYLHLLENGRCKTDRNAIMYGYWKSAVASGAEEPKAHTLAEIGGVTYDAARKALIRYRAGRLPIPKQDGLSPKTVRNVHTMLTAALSDAVRWDYIPRNHAADAKPPRAPRPAREVWTAEQLRRFITQVRNDRFYALWLLVCTTGLRRGELAGLRRNGVDLDNGRIANSTTRVVVGGRAEDSDTKTESSRRSVALDPVTLDALRSYVRLWDIEREEFQHQGTVLFCWPDGRPIHPETISDWFAQHSIAAGLPPIRLHDVRHSYATAALRAGVPVKVVSERLGHSSVAFPQQVYMHVIPGMDAEGAQLAAAAILGTVSGPNSPGDAAVTNSVTTGPDSPLL
ncbi:MAG: site-specific integrase [Actinomycetota bacterium]|nr:site-specific integrase [Actinomycetota bacterium]